jgi:hypothetical protein
MEAPMFKAGKMLKSMIPIGFACAFITICCIPAIAASDEPLFMPLEFSQGSYPQGSFFTLTLTGLAKNEVPKIYFFDKKNGAKFEPVMYVVS